MFLQVSGLEIAGNDTICSLTVPGRGYTNWECSISLLKVVIKFLTGLIYILCILVLVHQIQHNIICCSNFDKSTPFTI